MKALVLFLVLAPALALAGNSKMIEVDLDEDSTQIVKADLDQDDLYYYIDKTGCACWVEKEGKYAASIPCKGLKTHEKLKAHLEKCE